MEQVVFRLFLSCIDFFHLIPPSPFKTKKDGTPDKRRNPYRRLEQTRKDIDTISGINSELLEGGVK